ncbi:MAG: hypothetical protein JEZ12_25830 [Desulfobacterium sp.]|nr:hypothetical protein [Desulfobacterium sp.]
MQIFNRNIACHFTFGQQVFGKVLFFLGVIYGLLFNGALDDTGKTSEEGQAEESAGRAKDVFIRKSDNYPLNPVH